MGDGEKASLRLQFNPKVRLAFHGATITTDAGLLAFREFDDALGLTEIAEDYLQESRTGRNILHHLVPLLRQSIYSRLAGYDDTNDAVRLSQDPAMLVIVGWQGSERKGANTSEMGRFETEFLTQEDNRQAPKSAWNSTAQPSPPTLVFLLFESLMMPWALPKSLRTTSRKAGPDAISFWIFDGEKLPCLRRFSLRLSDSFPGTRAWRALFPRRRRISIAFSTRVPI